MSPDAGSGGLLVRVGGGPWTAPEQSGYSAEADLQEILFSHPALLPGVSSSAVACREFRSGAGPADVLIVTEAGDLLVVECKLAYNTQIRREIIGQVLDYASQLWGMDVEDFEGRWRERTGQSPFDAFGSGGDEVRHKSRPRCSPAHSRWCWPLTGSTRTSSGSWST